MDVKRILSPRSPRRTRDSDLKVYGEENSLAKIAKAAKKNQRFEFRDL
jgi:hypothetical protein